MTALPAGRSAEEYIALVRTFMPDFHRVACAETEDAFCDAVELAVRHCLSSLEDRRNVLASASEVELSTALADLLTRGGLPTKAEAHVNGHVDLVIQHFEAGSFRILGECKLDRGPKYHCEGAAQVLGYCSGVERRALCISFCKYADILTRMKEVREHFGEAEACHDVHETRDHALPWAFLCLHSHSSGSLVAVLHIGCNLHAP